MAEVAALLFDMDGTLVDTAEANWRAYAAALAEHGVAVGRDRFEALATGRHWRDFLLPFVAEAGASVSPELVARRKQALYPGFLTHSRLNAPLAAFAQAAATHLRLALVTSAAAASARAVLDAHGLSNLFDTVVTGDDVEHHKPAPDAYLLAAERLAVEPDCCLAFEDSDIGMESARRAGVTVMRVTA